MKDVYQLEKFFIRERSDFGCGFAKTSSNPQWKQQVRKSLKRPGSNPAED